MGLTFGIRPFGFEDARMILQNSSLSEMNLSFVDVVKKASEISNLRHFEITADLIYVLPGLITQETINALMDLKREYQWNFSVHLPLWSIEPSSPNQYIREASVNCIINTIRLTSPLEPTCYVLHATGALATEFYHMNVPGPMKDFIIAQFSLNACRSIEQILDATKIEPRRIAVENVEFPFKPFFESVEDLDVSICFDTGHLLAGYSGQWTVMDFLETYHDRIVELHLHDGRHPQIDHRPLGTHDLPVKELLTWLMDRNFTGPLVFELTYQGTVESLQYLQNVVPEALAP